MAFNMRGLSMVATNLGGVTPGVVNSIWFYLTTDAQSVVRTNGYFNAAANMLRKNDLIFTLTATGGTPAAYIAHVNANAAGVVDITDGLAVGTTDTD